MFGLIIIVLLVYWLYYDMIGKRKGLPPGPTPLPIVGNLLQFDATNPIVSLVNYGKEYGPVFSLWIPKLEIFVCDYDLIKETFVKQGEIFSGRPEMFVLNIFTGTSDHRGIANSYGPVWREQRKFAQRVLREFGFGRNLMELRINTEIERLVDHIEGLLDKSGKAVINPKELFSVCIGSIIGSLVFGHPHEYDDRRFQNLKDLIIQFGALLVDPKTMLLENCPWLRYVPLLDNFNFKTFTDQEKAFRKFLQDELDAHRSWFDPNAEPTDYLEAFLKEQHRRKKAGEPEGSFSDWQLCIAAFDMWSPVYDTTVTTLCWAFLYMLHYPQVEGKVYEEIKEQIDADSPITMADKNRLPYTASTVNEVQRCGNIAILNAPRSTTQDCIVGGYAIKAGTTITPSVSAVHMDARFFPDPEAFKPERFLEEDGKMVKKVEQLNPFSLGKRKCLGQGLASKELFLIIANLIRKFKFSPLEGQDKPTMEPIYGITRAPVVYEMMVQKRS